MESGPQRMAVAGGVRRATGTSENGTTEVGPLRSVHVAKNIYNKEYSAVKVNDKKKIAK